MASLLQYFITGLTGTAFEEFPIEFEEIFVNSRIFAETLAAGRRERFPEPLVRVHEKVMEHSLRGMYGAGPEAR